MNQMGSVLSVIILFVFLYFVLIRPQNKRQKKLEEERNSMKIGDEVLTAGGFYGVISAIDDDNVVIEMLPDFHKAMIRKQSIVQVLRPEDENEEKEEKGGLFGRKNKKKAAEKAEEAEAFDNDAVKEEVAEVKEEAEEAKAAEDAKTADDAKDGKEDKAE